MIFCLNYVIVALVCEGRRDFTWFLCKSTTDGGGRSLAEEVGHDEVENDVREDEIGEGALRADMRELRLVLIVHLDAQANS